MKDYSYDLHKKYLKEQVSATISDDPKERIVNYLENEDLLEKIAALASELDDNTMHELQLDAKEYGITEGDILYLQADKTNKDKPKFLLWVMNDEIMFGDLDLEAAATILYDAGKGWGTEEDKFAGLSGAIGRIAKEKKMDPLPIFKKLNEVFISKYPDAKSIEDWIDEEFSGRAEAAALNAYRQNIPSSIMRGVTDNIGTILTDVALTALTFGGSSAVSGALKGVAGGSKVLTNVARTAEVTAKTAQVGATAEKGVAATGKIAQAASKLKNAWSGLSEAIKISRFKKAYPIGSEIKYAAKNGKDVVYTIEKIEKDNGVMKVFFKGENRTRVALTDLAEFAGQPGGISLSSLAKLVPTTAAAGTGLAIKKTSDVGSNVNAPTSQSDFNVAEIMGYYDTLAADPNAYIEDTKQQGPDVLASRILDLKRGSGLFGNTTEQEELAMALIITSLDPESCNLVAERYKKLDPGSTVYAVLDDELGGDLAIFAKAWWTGCTKEGKDLEEVISQIYQSIKK